MERFITFLAVAILAYVLLLLFFFLFQRHFIYHPTQSIEMNPHYDQQRSNVIEYTTADDLTLKAVYQAAAPNHPTLLVFFGNAGYLGQLLPTQEGLLQQGYGIFAVAYRGYSGNPGKPSEQGLYEDARSAMRYLRQQGIEERDIILYGESLGSGVAVQLATEIDARALILQAPYSSMLENANIHYPYLPNRLLLIDRYDSINKIAHINMPLLVLHGEDDQVIPLEEAKRLYERALQPKKLIVLSNTQHNNIADQSQLVLEWLQAL